MKTIYCSPTWRADVARAAETLPELDRLAGKRVMITGAAGLICSSLVDILFHYNDTHAEKITIVAAGRWPEEMGGRFGERTERDDFIFTVYDAARTDNQLDLPVDFIIHGASNASPDMVMKEPVETILSNVLGVHSMLALAKKSQAKRVLYISSSEVYGQKQRPEAFREDEYGFIDQLNPRNSYSVGKRAAENMCASFAAEYGMESVIVRPGHIYGPTASVYDKRVSSAFAWAAARGEDLVMKSDGSQLRSYCHSLDCATAMLKVLILGENCHAYNISNPDSIITIAEMAKLLADAGGVSLCRAAATDEEKKQFNPMQNSSLDSAGLERLGWRGCFDAPTGLGHTVQVMRDMLSA